MDEKLALHTAARRYCMERSPGLNPSYEEQRYQDRRWIHNRDILISWAEGRGTYAQIELLGAILFRIEQCVPDNFSTLDSLKTFLTEVAQSESFDYEREDIECEIDRERELFQSYIESLSTYDLNTVAPLPYRRVLGERELQDIWQRIEQRWGITARMHWYPLNQVVPPPHVIALQEPWFAYVVPLDELRAILRRNGVERIWELREAGMSSQYRMDMELLIPIDGGGEHCWTSETLDWLIYTSHENSITLCGEWLIKGIEEVWPEWEEHIYTGHHYAFPPWS